MKKQIFSNVSTPSLFEMAHKAGYTIIEAGYTNERKAAVKLNGVKMAASDARKVILAECEFYTFDDAPCIV